MFPVQLEGERVLLRELHESDWVEMQAYAADPEVVKYETWGPNSEEQTREFLRYAISVQREIPRRNFEVAVVLKESGKLIGACGIRVKDVLHRHADMGYSLRRDVWGKGLGTEAARILVRFGFTELQLHRIWATCHIENRGSARVLEKAGLKREGLLRKNALQRGEWRDSYLYAVLESDAWQ